MDSPSSPPAAMTRDSSAHPLQLWIQHTPLAIAFFDREMRYVMASDRWIEDYGLGAQTIIGRCHYDVFPEIGDEWKAIHQRCLAGARESREEDPFPGRDGHLDWLRWDVYPWHQPDGAIGGIVMVTEVITARKQAEAALTEANARLQAEAAQRSTEMDGFFNLTLDMLCIAGFDGYFKRLNPIFGQVLGYSPEELMAAPFLSFVHPEDQAKTLEAAQRLGAGGDVVSFENRYRCRDGSYRWLSWSCYADMDRQMIYATARDITPQKQNADALRKQALLLEQVKGSIIATNLDGIITHWSPGATALYGYTPAEAIGQHVRLLYPGHLHQTLGDDILTTLHRQGHYELETVNCHRSGQEIEVFLSLSLEKNEQGTVVGIISYTMDIGDRKRAQRQLWQQEQFLRSVFEGSEHIIFVVDVEYREDGRTFCFSGWNRAAEERVGISRSAILGKSPIVAFGEEQGGVVQSRYDRCAQSKTPIQYEENSPLPQQGTWWLTTLNPLEDETGTVYRIVGTTTEITQRKQAELRMEEYADRQALINQLANQIRSSLDLDTVLDSTLETIRRLLHIDYCAFAWYRPDRDPPSWDVIKETRLPEVASNIGSFPASLVGPIDTLLLNQEVLQIDDASQYEEPIHRAFLEQSEGKSEMLLPIRNHDHPDQIGVIICVHCQQVRPWQEGEVSLLEAVGAQLAIAIDQAELYAESRQKSEELEQALLELQRTQVQMVQAEKMSSLGQLVAGVAHEINNPVNFIFGNLNHAKEYTNDLLEIVRLYQTHFPDPGEEIKTAAEDLELDFLTTDLPKLLSSMKVGADRIRSIVSSLRIFSRMDEADMKAVDIHEGIDSTLMILQNRLKRQPHRLEITIDKHYGDLPLVECYPGQLNQVFMNIISNAIDALEERCQQIPNFEPRITLRTELDPQKQVRIAIADNGPGIPAPVRSRIFDPFFTTKAVGKGTGMGLSISYQIVTERHGGSLTCHPVLEGSGTEFAIVIPQSQQSA